ncbi:MAG: hypothetical protein CMB79_01420 [Filomicrobium sp.]|nr:hypothetical protein [Filomicrobium sp.]
MLSFGSHPFRQSTAVVPPSFGFDDVGIVSGAAGSVFAQKDHWLFGVMRIDDRVLGSLLPVGLQCEHRLFNN